MHLQQATDAASAARMHTVHRPMAHHSGSLLSASAKPSSLSMAPALSSAAPLYDTHRGATPPAVLADQVAAQRAVQLAQLQHMVQGGGGGQPAGLGPLDAYAAALHQQYVAAALAAAVNGDMSYYNDLLLAASRPQSGATDFSPSPPGAAAAHTYWDGGRQPAALVAARDNMGRHEVAGAEVQLRAPPPPPPADCRRKQRLALLDEQNLTEDEILAVAVLAGLGTCDRRGTASN